MLLLAAISRGTYLTDGTRLVQVRRTLNFERGVLVEDCAVSADEESALSTIDLHELESWSVVAVVPVADEELDEPSA